MKKASIWVSAALYFGLGIVVLSLILAAGMPVINKLKDKNTIIQTKDIMFDLDNLIRDVARSGAGERRAVNIDIKKGQFMINEDLDEITWETESKIQVSEIDAPYQEGNLKIFTDESKIEGEYLTTLTLDYSIELIDLNYEDPTQVVTGQNRLIIENKGKIGDKIDITISSV